MEEKARNLEFKSFETKEEVCKWVNQYQRLIDIGHITYDSLREEFVVFFYWK
jgi:hypothetical protein